MQDYLARMLSLVEEAGKISLRLRGSPRASLKPDHSVITAADREVSTLARKILGDLLSTQGHLLIDEEDEGKDRYYDWDTINKFPYVWSIDPIDGTRIYANQMPTYGISIGLLKDLRPWLGAVYFPVLKELFYCDGTGSFFVQNAFSPGQVTTAIRPVDQQISSQSIILCHDAFFKYYQWDYQDCHVMIQACAAVDLCWAAIGRSCGTIFKSSLWDFAGSWPIVRSGGLEFRTLKDGKVMDTLNADFFTQKVEPWKLKEFFILSSERNFSIIKSKIRSV